MLLLLWLELGKCCGRYLNNNVFIVLRARQYFGEYPLAKCCCFCKQSWQCFGRYLLDDIVVVGRVRQCCGRYLRANVFVAVVGSARRCSGPYILANVLLLLLYAELGMKC